MKKIASILILFVISIILSSCVFRDRPDDNKYYGPTYGEPMEKGDFIVCLRSDGYYQIIDFSSSAKDAKVLIFPDQIDGIPVMGIGIPDTFYLETYNYIYEDVYVNRLNYLINQLNGSIDLEMEPYPAGWYMSMNNEELFQMESSNCEAIYVNSHHVNDISRFLNIFLYSPSRRKTYTYYTVYDRYLHHAFKENENWSSVIGLGPHKTILNYNFGFGSEADNGENYLINQFWYNFNLRNERKNWTTDDISAYNTEYNLNVEINDDIAMNAFWYNYYQYDYRVFLYLEELDIEDYYRKVIISKSNYDNIMDNWEKMHNEFCEFFEEYTGCDDAHEYVSQIDELNQYCSEYKQKYNVYPEEYDEYIKMSSFTAVTNKYYNKALLYIERYSLLANVEFRYNLEIDGELYHNISHLDDLYWIDYVLDGNKVMKPSDPFVEGYKFIGWYSDPEYNNEWNFDEDLIHEIENEVVWQTLYAKFEKIS